MAKQKTKEGVISQLETSLEGLFLKKLPALPKKVKDFIVQFSPWMAVVALVMSLPTILGVLGLRGMMSRYWGYGYGLGYGYSIAVWISIVSMVLMAVALPGLFKRALFAWELLFYSVLIMAVYNLVIFNLGNLIIGTGISMYILFQIKSYYK